MRNVQEWFFPSFYGDIRLEAKGPGTLVVYERLSPTEVKAMEALRDRATSGALLDRRPWAAKDAFPAFTQESVGAVQLDAPIQTVQRFLVRHLKPERATVSAVKFVDGRIEEVRSTAAEVKPKAIGPFRESAPDPEVIEPEADAPKPKKDPPVVGVTVAKPVLGCPAPAFERAELRAERVLRTFLSATQVADFDQKNAFVSTGVDTGSRYLLISRHAHAMLERFGGRSLYSITRREPLCVHDWEVPAPEELLGIHVMLSIPGGESYLTRVSG